MSSGARSGSGRSVFARNGTVRDRPDRELRRIAAEAGRLAGFRAASRSLLVLKPDLTISAVSDAFLNNTRLERASLVGRELFSTFEKGPAGANTEGIEQMDRSLGRILATRAADDMPVQRYDIRAPDGTYVERYWLSQNYPVFDENGELSLIVHQSADVTEGVRQRGREGVRFPEPPALHMPHAPGESGTSARAKIAAIGRRLEGLGLLRQVVSEPLFKGMLDLLVCETEEEIARLSGEAGFAEL